MMIQAVDIPLDRDSRRAGEAMGDQPRCAIRDDAENQLRPRIISPEQLQGAGTKMEWVHHSVGSLMSHSFGMP